MRAGAVLETLLGLLVLIAAAAFLVYSQGRLDAGPGRDSYGLTARFSTVGDLSRGAEVRVAGVPVGSVQAIELDPETYFARVEMTVRPDIEIPDDSTAKIATAGLLGGAYVEIEPGGGADVLQPGDEIAFTQGAVDMFDLIGQAIGGGG